MLLDASITATFDVANTSCGAGLWLKTGRPLTVIFMDFTVSVAKLLLKSTLIVPVNATGEGNGKLLKLPDSAKVSITSAFAAEAAIRASAAKTVADADLLVHKENNVCPPAKEFDGFIGPPIRPSPGIALPSLCAYTINHPAPTTKHHATNLFCDLDHTTIARIA
jgi:hypothetical protein